MRGRHQFLFPFWFTFIRRFQPVKEYLWIVVARTIIDRTVMNQPYEGLEKSQTGMVFADSSMETIRVLCLDSTRGLPVPLTLAALTMTTTKA